MEFNIITSIDDVISEIRKKDKKKTSIYSY